MVRKQFQPNKPVTPSSLARLISLFYHREGEQCPAAIAADEILSSKIGREDVGVQSAVLGQLRELEKTHQVFNGSRVDHRSKAAIREGSNQIG